MDSLAVLVGGVLWRLGGAGAKPIGRNWRRIGLPCVIFYLTLSSHHNVFLSLLAALISHLTLRLPITLFGDSIWASIWNVPWLFVLGYLYGTPSLLFGSGLLSPLIPCLTVSVLTVLSNIPSTSRIFVWEAVEMAVGVSVILSFI